MNFQVLSVLTAKESDCSEANTAYLTIDHWNDFSFVTQFHLCLRDGNDILHDIGKVKIGFLKQTEEVPTYSNIKECFTNLSQDYFSLGQDIEYYQNISKLPTKVKDELLMSLNDIVSTPSLIENAKNENVFRTSLLRDVSLSIIKGQFRRVLDGQAPLTDYKFSFKRSETNTRTSKIALKFKITPNSKPSTNIHAIIGRNGVGKTTLLNNMIGAITNKEATTHQFVDLDHWSSESPISADYFSSLVSVSFSAFDPFTPPKEQADPSKGTCYSYIGLKDREQEGALLNEKDLRKECVGALIKCFQNKSKTKRWHAAIQKLSSDMNFESMGLPILEEKFGNLQDLDPESLNKSYLEIVEPYLERMSSGHTIVLLTITRLVATVEEKTFILLDEPESHLHPPLLSAFIRALSDLLYDRNGVAIIATHSPVVLQEVPKSCVWKINRSGVSMKSTRPDIETFGENVGALTRDVFGLEVSKSGFHDILAESVNKGDSYEEVLNAYNEQLGIEGRMLLKALVENRDRGTP
tara:strand:+ start:12798 stop:14366 length:1569 start_codon:yes stop_codon:yes gene_type:complete